MLNLIRLYGRSEAEWRASSRGLSLFEGTFQVFAPELAGLVAPTVVGSRERQTDPDTGLPIVVDQPLAARVTTAVRRAIAYAALSSTPNADKRVAVLFYNYPPGKATIGASYLNVAESLSNILRRMRAAGYDVGGPGVDLSARALEREVIARAHNVGGYAPGQLDALIWGDETLRHEGILESQIFHLLGARPVWDARGKVVDVEVVPTRQLGRPRIDIVIASSAAGMFSNVTRLMDEAVQRVKVLEEADNYVRRHYLATRLALIDRGYAEEDADRRAGVRIFDESPGRFNLNTSRIAAASGTWDSDRPMAGEYLSKMGHGYGNGFWGEAMEDVFRLALSGTEKVVHSSSTMVYGALDNDDFFMYMGGLAAAVRSIDGESPQMVVTNTRDPGRPEMTGIDEFIGAEFRPRYVNPTWIEGMQREGYAGAGEMRAFVEYLWGWDATVPETVDDAMWQESFAVYIEDRHDLGLKTFFDEHSPHAYQDITGRMVETIRKGYWAAVDATIERLLREHVESVAAHGVGCSSHTCGNPRLLRYVLERGAAMNVPGSLLAAYRAAMEAAIGTDIEIAAAAAEKFVRRNEARAAGPTTINIDGYRMTETTKGSTLPPTVPASSATADGWAALWVGLPLLGLLAAWRRCRRHASRP